MVKNKSPSRYAKHRYDDTEINGFHRILLSLQALFLFVFPCKTIHRIQNNNDCAKDSDQNHIHQRDHHSGGNLLMNPKKNYEPYNNRQNR